MNNFKDMEYFSGPNFGELTICADNGAGTTGTRLLSGILYF